MDHATYQDAHNHLQDERLAPHRRRVIEGTRRAGITAMVVNGTSEADWPIVAELAQNEPDLICPSFGLHPWFITSRSTTWEHTLRAHLEQPGAVLGEIGLDGWKKDLPRDGQETVFLAQWRLAVEHDVPVTVHGLKAWSWLLDVIRREPRLPRGFLLHSYSGPKEYIAPFAEQGAYFSFCSALTRGREEKIAALYRAIPRERLLVETDAPDQRPPEQWITHPLDSTAGEPLHHPANLPATTTLLAQLLDENEQTLRSSLTANFSRFFGFPAHPSLS